MEMPSIGTKIEQVLAISNAYMKGPPWLPEVQEVSGIQFVKVDKWDRGLVRFTTGKGLSFRASKKHDANVRFLEDLQRRRTAACDAAVQEAYATQDAFDPRPKKKLRRAKPSDRDIAPAILQVECPEVQRGEYTLGPVTMAMLFGIKNAPLWIECTVPNMEYLRHGILASHDRVGCGTSICISLPYISAQSCGLHCCFHMQALFILQACSATLKDEAERGRHWAKLQSQEDLPEEGPDEPDQQGPDEQDLDEPDQQGPDEQDLAAQADEKEGPDSDELEEDSALEGPAQLTEDLYMRAECQHDDLYIYIYIHMYMYMQPRTYVCASGQASMSVYIYTYKDAYIHAYIHTDAYVYTYMYTDIHMSTL